MAEDRTFEWWRWMTLKNGILGMVEVKPKRKEMNATPNRSENGYVPLSHSCARGSVIYRVHKTSLSPG